MFKVGTGPFTLTSFLSGALICWHEHEPPTLQLLFRIFHRCCCNIGLVL